MAKNQKAKNRKKDSDKSLAAKIFENPFSIIIVLIVFSISLMVYNRFLIKNITLYSFCGFEDKFSILNGTIYTSYDINYFGDSKVVYTGDDVDLLTYEIGYYIKTDSTYREVSVLKSDPSKEASDLKDLTVSLKDLLNTTDFSFTEVKKDAQFLSKENVKKLDKLIFRVKGKNEKSEEVNFEIPIEVEKVTR